MKKRRLFTLPLILFILYALLFPCAARSPKFVDTAGLLDERQWAVSTCGEAIQAVSDSDLDKIMQHVTPHLSDGEYDQAFHLFAGLVEEEYSKGKNSGENGFLRFIIALAIGAAISGIALFIMRRSMNTARSQSGAASYMVNNSFELYRCQDFYLYSRTSKVRKAENTSSTHRSSSGRSHGGRSGRF